MNVLFIYPFEQPLHSQNFEFHRKNEYPVQFNFAIAGLSAILKKAGHQTRLDPLQSTRQPMDADKIAWADVFLFSISEVEMEWTAQLTHELFSLYPDKPQVVGGVGPTLNPEFCFENMEAGYICQGEGDLALPELLKRLENGQDTRGIPNLHVRSGKRIHRSPIGQIVEDLDTLPPYDFEMFDEFPQRHLTSNMPRLYYLATRNCIFRCTFCANSRKKDAMGLAPGANYVRSFSPSRVISDLESMRKRYPQARVVHFNDEIIHASPKWFREFARLYAKKIGMPWRSYASLAVLTKEAVDLMKLSNCYRVNVGIEAGSERIRNDIYNRPPVSNEDMLTRMRWLKEAGIGIHGSNLFGAPTETIDEMYETLMINAEGGVDVPTSGIVVPYHNTPLYEISRKLGRLDHVRYDNKGVSIRPEPGTTMQQIMFIREYFVELVKIMQFALSLDSPLGTRMISFIRWMIHTPEFPFEILLNLHPLLFRDRSLDLVYEAMETRFGRTKTTELPLPEYDATNASNWETRVTEFEKVVTLFRKRMQESRMKQHPEFLDTYSPVFGAILNYIRDIDEDVRQMIEDFLLDFISDPDVPVEILLKLQPVFFSRERLAAAALSLELGE